MVIHIKQGKGSRDRDVPMTPKLPEALALAQPAMKRDHLADVGVASGSDAIGSPPK
jgi:hypothetical protein